MNKTDDVDADGKCTMVVSLMQKSSDMSNELFISIQMYKVCYTFKNNVSSIC